MIIQLLVCVGLFLVGMEGGERVARRRLAAPAHVTLFQRGVRFWLAGSDGRVNYSRATVAVGLGSFLAFMAVILRKYVTDDHAPIEALYAGLMATCATLGINLGQYGFSLVRDVKMAALPAAPAPAADAPPSTAAARDSGIGPGPDAR